MAASSKVAIVFLAAGGLCLAADPVLPRQLEGVGIDEKLGGPVDFNLEFMSTDGYAKPLSKFVRPGRPVILNFVYYTCPMLCNLVLNGAASVLREIPWTPGNEFDVLTISIDPTETWNLAAEKRATVLSSYGKPAPGWHFFTDYNGNVKKLADQAGWRYRFDQHTGQYAHSSAIMILTPEGKISRYLYGIKYKPRDVRLALAEASESKIGMTTERILLMCFHYDETAGTYVAFAGNAMRVGGVLTMLAIGFFLYRMWRGERRGRPASLSPNLAVKRQ